MDKLQQIMMYLCTVSLSYYLEAATCVKIPDSPTARTCYTYYVSCSYIFCIHPFFQFVKSQLDSKIPDGLLQRYVGLIQIFPGGLSNSAYATPFTQTMVYMFLPCTFRKIHTICPFLLSAYRTSSHETSSKGIFCFENSPDISIPHIFKHLKNALYIQNRHQTKWLNFNSQMVDSFGLKGMWSNALILQHPI